MKIGPIDVSIFTAYFALVLLVGLVSAKKGKQSAKDYFMAGDKLPWFIAAASIIAANQSTHALVGMTGSGYIYGMITANMILLAIPMGQTFLAWLLLPLYMKTGAFTVPQFMEIRYDIRSRVAFGGLTVVSHVVVEISTVLYLGGVALSCLFPEHYLLLGAVDPLWVGVFGISAVTCFYTLYGGLLSVVWTEVVQLVLMLAAGFVLAFVGVNKIGGWSALVAAVPHEKMRLMMPIHHDAYPALGVFLAAPIASFFYWGTNQFLVQRPLACKDGWHGRMSLIGAGYITLLLPIYVVIPGIAASVLFPGLKTGDEAFPTLVAKLLPTGLIGLVMAGLIAGMMSHVAGALNSASTIVTVDFYKRLFRKEANDDQMVRFGKWAGFVMLVLATLWSPLVGKGGRLVFIYIQDAYGYFAPGIVTAFFMGMFWKRGNGNGAFASILTTLPVCLTMHFAWPGLVFWYRTLIATAICVVVYRYVSLRTAPPPPEKTEGLMWTPQVLKEAYPKGTTITLRRNPLFWWLLVNLILVGIDVWLR